MSSHSKLRRACATMRGFTLVEVLVAAAILSLLAVALVVALRSVATTETRIDARIAAEEEIRSAERFLRTAVGRVSPLSARTEGGRPPRIAFRGERTEMDWIGVMPARHGAGGLYRFRIELRAADGGPTGEVVLSYAPMTNRDSPLDSQPLESRVLVRRVSDLALAYFDSDAAEPTWAPSWNDANRLPTLIGVQIQAEAGNWPVIQIALRPTRDAARKGQGGGSSGISIGPF